MSSSEIAERLIEETLNPKLPIAGQSAALAGQSERDQPPGAATVAESVPPDQRPLNELMADWTQRLGIFTGWLAGVTTLLVVLSGISAYFLWNSNRTLQAQLNEMHMQTVTTRAQVRANIAMDKIQIEPNVENGTVAGWNIAPLWKNSGATDALNVEQWWGLAFVDQPMSVATGIRCGRPARASNEKPLTVQAGRTFAQLAQQVTLDQLQKASVLKAGILVVMHLQYNDIFPDDLPTTLDSCTRIIPIDIPNMKASFIDLESVSR